MSKIINQGEQKSLSRNQTLVLSALQQAKMPLSAYALLDLLRDEGLRAPPQIYRALEQLIAAGMAHKLESMNAYIACSFGGDHHCDEDKCSGSQAIAFSICEVCSQVEEIHNDQFYHMAVKSLARDGFEIKNTTLELRGMCKACRS